MRKGMRKGVLTDDSVNQPPASYHCLNYISLYESVL